MIVAAARQTADGRCRAREDLPERLTAKAAFQGRRQHGVEIGVKRHIRQTVRRQNPDHALSRPPECGNERKKIRRQGKRQHFARLVERRLQENDNDVRIFCGAHRFLADIFGPCLRAGIPRRTSDDRKGAHALQRVARFADDGNARPRFQGQDPAVFEQDDALARRLQAERAQIGRLHGGRHDLVDAVGEIDHAIRRGVRRRGRDGNAVRFRALQFTLGDAARRALLRQLAVSPERAGERNAAPAEADAPREKGMIVHIGRELLRKGDDVLSVFARDDIRKEPHVCPEIPAARTVERGDDRIGRSALRRLHEGLADKVIHRARILVDIEAGDVLFVARKPRIGARSACRTDGPCHRGARLAVEERIFGESAHGVVGRTLQVGRHKEIGSLGARLYGGRLRHLSDQGEIPCRRHARIGGHSRFRRQGREQSRPNRRNAKRCNVRIGKRRNVREQCRLLIVRQFIKNALVLQHIPLCLLHAA